MSVKELLRDELDELARVFAHYDTILLYGFVPTIEETMCYVRACGRLEEMAVAMDIVLR